MSLSERERGETKLKLISLCPNLGCANISKGIIKLSQLDLNLGFLLFIFHIRFVVIPEWLKVDQINCCMKL